jgi:hypothetical protein
MAVLPVITPGCEGAAEVMVSATVFKAPCPQTLFALTVS